MNIEKANINELISPDWNPRQITEEEMEKLKNSIKEFGYIDPLIVNQHNNHIVGGNQRYKALKEMGYDEVDVIFINEPNISKEKAMNLALNKISGDWDQDKLDIILEEIQLSDIDITLTGFDEIEFTNLSDDEE
ncbi:MAG: ParB N-terminal domain-containing protein, partial [Alphaproteobacteria bacterium]|nr:ParB N-terminal domain-containing protein [Alphaproteobacteria bacterium]